MSRKKEVRREKLLTQVELELMNILWRLGRGGVHDVLSLLPADRKLAYTSVSTVLRILEQKEFVTTEKAGRGHVYVPAVAKHDYEALTLSDVVSRVFDGTASSLVRRLLETEDLSPDDLREIQTLLDERLGG